MMGHAEAWLFGRLAGITVDFLRDADRVVTIAPKPVGQVPSASATARSPFGNVASRWRRRNRALMLEVLASPGTRTSIVVPTAYAGHVRVNGRAPASAAGVLSATAVSMGLDLVVAPGRYRFTAPG
jgi:alpha-L-rhamnosidase